MVATKASSVPPTTSASAIDASLPDWTIMPRRSSSTETARRGSMNMRDPSAFHARCDTSTICEGTIALLRNAPKTI